MAHLLCSRLFLVTPELHSLLEAETCSMSPLGTANLMLDASEGQLAFCPAASSALSSVDVSSGIKGPTRLSLGNTLDSESSCQGSLSDCSWGSNGTMLLKTHNGGLYTVNR
jgi:hypothetical protein